MKSASLALILLVILIPVSTFANGPVFGIKPNQGMHNGFVGYVLGDIVVYGGLDLVAVGGTYEGVDQDFDFDSAGTSLVMTRQQTWDYNATGNLIMPRLGAKFYFGAEEMRPYVFGDIFKVFPSIDLSGQETDLTYHDDGSVDTEEYRNVSFNGDVEGTVEDILDAWGINIGFGAEYKFAEHFAIGGEYALRYARINSVSNTGDSHTNLSGKIDHKDEYSTNIGATLKISYVAAVMSFYF